MKSMGKGGGSCDSRAPLSLSNSGGVGVLDQSRPPEPITLANGAEVTDLTVWNKLSIAQQTELLRMEWREEDLVEQLFAARTAKDLGVHPISAVRLERENFGGADYSEYKRYMHPSSRDIRSPEATVVGMRAASKHLVTEIDKGSKVAVFADYDVDGNTSGRVMEMALQEAGGDPSQIIMGYASARDGFGLTKAFVKSAYDQGATTLITLDCGSSQTAQISYAQKLGDEAGMKVIVVDHHDVDMDNPVDFHLNPRFRQGLRHQRGLKIVADAKDCDKQLKALKRKLVKNPDDTDLQNALIELEARHDKLHDKLVAFAGAGIHESSDMEIALKRATKQLDTMMDADMNTGAQLTWKLGAALLEERHGKTPQEWYGEPLYLAGLGALADRGNMQNVENRAFARHPLDQFGDAVIPLGVKLLADAFEEDATDPGGMMRTKSTLNLAKRTSRVDAERVVALYRARTPQEAAPHLEFLLQEHERSATARDEMEALCRKDIAERMEKNKQQKKKAGDRYWVHAVVNDPAYEEYVGQAGIIAPRLAKEVGLPAIVFTRQGLDAEGNVQMKWSARNGQVRTKIGGLLGPPWREELGKNCQLAHVDEDGNVEIGASMGGHEDVVSGSCRLENIPAVMGVLNKFGEKMHYKSKDHSSWTPKTRDRVYCAKRLVPASEIPQLEQELPLFKPTTNDNYATRVSVAASVESIGEQDPDRKTFPAILNIDGLLRECDVHESAYQTLQHGGVWEIAVTPGEPRYYIKDLRPLGHSI